MPAPPSPTGDSLDAVLRALSDATRRQVFVRLADDGPLTATDLAGDLPVSRQAIAKHLDVLGTAGLASWERIGRETRWRAEPQPLEVARSWFDDVERSWDRRLGSLADLAEARSRRRGDPPRDR